jgi:hypothetical protein
MFRNICSGGTISILITLKASHAVSSFTIEMLQLDADLKIPWT